MQGAIAPTDYDWYDFLRGRGGLEEVNFWTPSTHHDFRGEPFSPFLFKLKAPHNAICGFAYFARYSPLPDWLAWEAFGIGNGCASLAAMRSRIGRLRRGMDYRGAGPRSQIGCILLVQPTFFPPGGWIAQPGDWPARSLRATRYDLSQGEGRRVWEACLARVQPTSPMAWTEAGDEQVPASQYGAPQVVFPRLGQGTFRIAVTDAYGRACAVTREHSLPALDASHIRAFASAGPHEVRNGILLRADLHRLFDQGYMTVTPEYEVAVSPRLRSEYHNGHSYYPLHGTRLSVPSAPGDRPAVEFLQWHNETVFLGN
jgi:putative restriction endonuclease